MTLLPVCLIRSVHTVQGRFGITLDNSWLMELESVAEHKFSRHIIIEIPGKAFAHNIHAGAFVNEVCEIARQGESAEARLEVIKASPVLWQSD